MLAALAGAAVPLKAIQHNPAKVQPVGPALQALCSKDAELKVCLPWLFSSESLERTTVSCDSRAGLSTWPLIMEGS